MALRWIIVLLSFLILSFNACKSTPDLNEDELYGIVNQIIADDSLAIARVCWKFGDMPIKGEYVKEFNNDDISFIRRQKSIFKNYEIKPGKLKWLKQGTKTTTYTIVDKHCDVGILYHISFPLISKDRSKVLIEFHEDCNCMLGGQGGKELYEKKNNHWVKIKSFDSWISQNNLIEDDNLRPLL